MHPGRMAIGPNTVEGDSHRQKHESMRRLQCNARADVRSVVRALTWLFIIARQLFALFQNIVCRVQDKFCDWALMAA